MLVRLLVAHPQGGVKSLQRSLIPQQFFVGRWVLEGEFLEMGDVTELKDLRDANEVFGV